jgi:putative ABC transport system substrate-binding protein
VHRSQIIRSAEQYRVPAIFTYRQFVHEGALIAYGPDTMDIFLRSASYVDRILKGTNPGDLPIQAPNKFELAINSKTARRLWLDLPPTLLGLADEVIEPEQGHAPRCAPTTRAIGARVRPPGPSRRDGWPKIAAW